MSSLNVVDDEYLLNRYRKAKESGFLVLIIQENHLESYNSKDQLLKLRNEMRDVKEITQRMISEHYYGIQSRKSAEPRKRQMAKPISMVCDYIAEHYEDHISLDIVSEKVHMNPSYLSRLFKKETGGTFIDYLISFRIEKAKKYLTQTNMKGNDIATKVGYLSSKSFIRSFKRETGLTPGDFRNVRHQRVP